MTVGKSLQGNPFKEAVTIKSRVLHETLIMKEIRLPLPELFGIAATRGLVGAGVALLFGERLNSKTRHRLGLVLTSIGVVSTVPFAYDVLHRRRG
jgi:hypothetical protein